MKIQLIPVAMLVATTFGLLSPTGALAQSAPPAGVTKLNDFSYLVWASNPKAQPGKLQLVNRQSGSILYQEYSSGISFGQKFNVSGLPDGQYAFVVKIGGQKFSYPLSLRTTVQRSAELNTAAGSDSLRIAAKL
jgi:hypothetical protein